jgi:sister chromatid cohesion protein DCC1
VEELVSTLADEHEISRTVSTQVMSWFGVVKEEKWSMDVNSVLKELGIGLLKNHKVRRASGNGHSPCVNMFPQDDPIPKDEFIRIWKSVVGDTFESYVSLPLLSVRFASTKCIFSFSLMAYSASRATSFSPQTQI